MPQASSKAMIQRPAPNHASINTPIPTRLPPQVNRVVKALPARRLRVLQGLLDHESIETISDATNITTDQVMQEVQSLLDRLDTPCIDCLRKLFDA